MTRSSDNSDRESVSGVVFVALREEFRPLVPQLKRRTTRRAGSLRFVVGSVNEVRVAICRTGIGVANSARRAEELLELVAPEWVLVTGFAGGVAPQWQPGDCLVASEVVELPATGPDDETPDPTRRWLAPDIAMRLKSENRRPPVRCGRLATVTDVLRSPEEKQRVGTRFAVDAVEMESAGILEQTTRRSIPTVCVRVILDEHDFGLPLDFGPLMSAEGDRRLVKTLLAIGSRPDKWRQVARLRARAVSAGESLGRLFPHLVETLGRSR